MRINSLQVHPTPMWTSTLRRCQATPVSDCVKLKHNHPRPSLFLWLPFAPLSSLSFHFLFSHFTCSPPLFIGLSCFLSSTSSPSFHPLSCNFFLTPSSLFLLRYFFFSLLFLYESNFPFPSFYFVSSCSYLLSLFLPLPLLFLFFIFSLSLSLLFPCLFGFS